MTFVRRSHCFCTHINVICINVIRVLLPVQILQPHTRVIIYRETDRRQRLTRLITLMLMCQDNVCVFIWSGEMSRCVVQSSSRTDAQNHTGQLWSILTQMLRSYRCFRTDNTHMLWCFRSGSSCGSHPSWPNPRAQTDPQRSSKERQRHRRERQRCMRVLRKLYLNKALHPLQFCKREENAFIIWGNRTRVDVPRWGSDAVPCLNREKLFLSDACVLQLGTFPRRGTWNTRRLIWESKTSPWNHKSQQRNAGHH